MSDPTLKATVCPHCGTPAAPGEGFCRNCGKQLFAPTITAPPPVVPGLQQRPAQSFSQPRKKGRSKLMMGCLVIIGLFVVAAGAGGIYIWRRTSYTPPVRKAPAIPERAAGTMTEFPVDNDKDAPAKPTSVQTESLSGTTAKAERLVFDQTAARCRPLKTVEGRDDHDVFDLQAEAKSSCVSSAG